MHVTCLPLRYHTPPQKKKFTCLLSPHVSKSLANSEHLTHSVVFSFPERYIIGIIQYIDFFQVCS